MQRLSSGLGVNSAKDDVAGLSISQRRFEGAVANIDVMVENASASRGRIVDADFAKETAELSRTQILMQAGTESIINNTNIRIS